MAAPHAWRCVHRLERVADAECVVLCVVCGAFVVVIAAGAVSQSSSRVVVAVVIVVAVAVAVAFIATQEI